MPWTGEEVKEYTWEQERKAPNKEGVKGQDIRGSREKWSHIGFLLEGKTKGKKRQINREQERKVVLRVGKKVRKKRRKR